VFGAWADYHLKIESHYTLEQLIAYVFVVDALNFCFWPNQDAFAPFEYEDMTRNLEQILISDPSFF